MISVKIKRISKNVLLPAYQTEHSSGVDLQADILEPVTLRSGERQLIPTGISVAIPAGFEAQIRPRSGLAIKKGLSLVNTPGTIDADYRGEIKVIAINLGKEPILIEKGERIAQMVFVPVVQARFEEVETLDETTRGAGGFGSTGG